VSRDRYEELRAGFTAAVSHELRTPLARLLALIDGAALPGADPAEALAKARIEVERMDELIDDVLFLSQLETRREVVSLGSTAAAPVVREVIETLGESAERAGVELRLEVQEERFELPLRARMLRIVVQNLAVNALRHAGDGVACVVALRHENGFRLLSVSDDGVGVGPEDLRASSSASTAPTVPAPRVGQVSASRSSSTSSRPRVGRSRQRPSLVMVSRSAASFHLAESLEGLIFGYGRSLRPCLRTTIAP
jgi:hypothetical protein